VFGESPIRSRLLLFKALFYFKGFAKRQAQRFSAWSAVRSHEA
jgi:hypothetical protein